MTFQIVLVVSMIVFALVGVWVLRTRPRRPVDVFAAPPSEPFDCPHCGGRIALVGLEYQCHGLKDRAEVEMFLGADTAKNVVVLPPCGWKGAAARYGKGWA